MPQEEAEGKRMTAWDIIGPIPLMLLCGFVVWAIWHRVKCVNYFVQETGRPRRDWDRLTKRQRYDWLVAYKDWLAFKKMDRKHRRKRKAESKA